MTRRISAADAIFLALADLRADQRDAVLRERCGADTQLRADVEALLAAIDEPDDGFLNPDEVPSIDMSALDGPLQPGKTLAGYLVLHAIGSGAMGVVYAAQQDRPRRTVAIKVLRRGFRHPDILRRFEREAAVLSRLQHPGIAQVFSFYAGGRQVPAHLVMELVDGPPITEYARAQGLDVMARVELIAMLCEAIQHAHDKGIVHRDLKPANVLVADGRPKILDFGIARATGMDVRTSVTAHGQLLGTLAYMSPEQLRGAKAEVDARSDLYAIGVLLFRLLAGRLPYDVTDLPIVEAAQHILRTDPPLLRALDPSLDESIDAITRRAMARDRSRRYQSAGELCADLRAYRDGQRAPAGTLSERRDSTGAASPIVALDPNAERMAIGLANGAIVILDARTGATLAHVDGRPAAVSSLVFLPDRRLSVTWKDGSGDTLNV